MRIGFARSIRLRVTHYSSQAEFIKNLEVEVMVSIASSLASNSRSTLPATYGRSLNFLPESLPFFLLVFYSNLTCLFFLTLTMYN